MLFFLFAYVVGGAILAYIVNEEHRRRFDKGIKGMALVRFIPLLALWPLTTFILMFPPTARYVETGSFKR